MLKVYRDGTPVPTASNLNSVTGQTIPNLVTVPMVAGKGDCPKPTAAVLNLTVTQPTAAAVLTPYPGR
ncbi:hypothetical protein AB0F73_05555 [Micromonospora purpureochromogenes]|uniref:hypothetical protein n=1 Tax=Micromonospora purpureochromogenes TaxID=47872 RepID=UPI0033D3A91D